MVSIIVAALAGCTSRSSREPVTLAADGISLTIRCDSVLVRFPRSRAVTYTSLALVGEGAGSPQWMPLDDTTAAAASRAEITDAVRAGYGLHVSRYPFASYLDLRSIRADVARLERGCREAS